MGSSKSFLPEIFAVLYPFFGHLSRSIGYEAENYGILAAKWGPKNCMTRIENPHRVAVGKRTIDFCAPHGLAPRCNTIFEGCFCAPNEFATGNQGHRSTSNAKNPENAVGRRPRFRGQLFARQSVFHCERQFGF